MKLLCSSAIAVTLFCAAAATAQEQRVPPANTTQNTTQDSAYYLNREAAARAAIQERAAWKAAQRQARIETNRWYGYSPLRPTALVYPSVGSSVHWMGPVVYYQYPGTYFPRSGFSY